MTDVAAKLQERKVAIEEQFKVLDEERLKIVEETIKPAQKRFTEIEAEKLRLQGSYTEVMQLIMGPDAPKESPETPKESKEPKKK